MVDLCGFPCGSDGKESACNAGDPRSIPGLRGSWVGRKRQPTLVFLPGQVRGAWPVTVHGVASCWICLSDFHFHS